MRETGTEIDRERDWYRDRQRERLVQRQTERERVVQRQTETEDTEIKTIDT